MRAYVYVEESPVTQVKVTLQTLRCSLRDAKDLRDAINEGRSDHLLHRENAIAKLLEHGVIRALKAG